MVKGGYTFEKYPVALPYNEGELMLMIGLVGNQPKASNAWSHMDLLGQNDYTERPT